MPYKMIGLYDCSEEPTKKEIQIILKLWKPGQKLLLLNNWMSLQGYVYQLIDENYLDRLLEGYTLKFVMNRFINELDGVTYLIENERLNTIILGIGYAPRS